MAEPCGIVLEMPLDPSGHAGSVFHVCGEPDGHSVGAEVPETYERRKHRCRRTGCAFWWIEMTTNPFAGGDHVEG